MIRELITRSTLGTTLLGAGPMSQNVIYAINNLAKKTTKPIMMIASRRQIDSESSCGSSGYVDRFSTEQFGNLKENSQFSNNIILCRDHGGPYQGALKATSYDEELKLTLNSFKADMDNNFRIIHIDTSVDIDSEINFELGIHRLLNIFGELDEYRKQKGYDIEFEIGAEEQSVTSADPERFEFFLSEVSKFTNKNNIDMPLFCVLQIGTKVLEDKNIGTFKSMIRVGSEVPIQIYLPKYLDICKRYGVLIKAHNNDYLDDSSIAALPILGIHAANIAPEFAVIENRLLMPGITLLPHDLYIAMSSDFELYPYWKKWVQNPYVEIEMNRKFELSAHYYQKKSWYKSLVELMAKRENLSNQDFNNVLQSSIQNNIYRYMKNFNYDFK